MPAAARWFAAGMSRSVNLVFNNPEGEKQVMAQGNPMAPFPNPGQSLFIEV